MDILQRIVEAKRLEVEALRPRARALRDAAEAAPPPRPFARALRREGEVALIAEIKRRSPSAGWIRPEASVGDVARAYEAAGAAALSVLTDGELVGGSPDDLREARSVTALPVVRKDFLPD